MTRIANSTALVGLAIPAAGAVAQTLSPTRCSKAERRRLQRMARHRASVSPSSRGRSSPEGINVRCKKYLRGFYVAHLLSGTISTTIGGQMTHLPGDYWTVKAGAAMQVEETGESAGLETIVAAKQ